MVEVMSKDEGNDDSLDDKVGDVMVAWKEVLVKVVYERPWPKG